MKTVKRGNWLRRSGLRVILIGGAPLSGKSTTARALARWLEWDLVHTDDLGVAVRQVTTPESRPDLHPMRGHDWREYLLSRSAPELLHDAVLAHAALWPAVASIASARATWSYPAVIEGWAILPESVRGMGIAVGSVWLTSADTTFEQRARSDPSLTLGRDESEALVKAFALRSQQFNAELRFQAEAQGDTTIEVSDSDSVLRVRNRILRHFYGVNDQGR